MKTATIEYEVNVKCVGAYEAIFSIVDNQTQKGVVFMVTEYRKRQRRSVAKACLKEAMQAAEERGYHVSEVIPR